MQSINLILIQASIRSIEIIIIEVVQIAAMTTPGPIWMTGTSEIADDLIAITLDNHHTINHITFILHLDITATHMMKDVLDPRKTYM